MEHGRLLDERRVFSRFLNASRTVRLYLPPSYDRQPRRRYPVLYLHDGQNLFSTAGPHSCFGWGGWELDKTTDRLCAGHRMREIIMVAVDNSRSRYIEYRGPANTPALSRPPASQRRTTPVSGQSRFEKYSAFLCQELKPSIDGEFRTRTDPAHTGILGSSMGGICSVAMAWQHPEVFGLAASLSGAFQVEKRFFLEHILRPYAGRRKPFKVYLDSGTVDFTGDDDGRKDTAAVVAELRRLGWEDPLNLQHLVDRRPMTEAELAQTGLPQHKWDEARRSQHNEFYWRQRVWRALEFLFPPAAQAKPRRKPLRSLAS